MTRPRTTWLAFVLLGVVDAVLLLEFPAAGAVVLALALAGIVLRAPRAAAVAGLVLGVGATWTALMVRVKLSCDAFNAVPGQECEAPGIETWILIGGTILVVGLLASVAVVLRARRG